MDSMASAGATTRTSRRRTRRRGRIRKGSGREATLAYLGHVLLDNQHGLVANGCVTAATGTRRTRRGGLDAGGERAAA